MAKIIKAEELPQGEKVYLKKDLFGYRIVEPIQDPETGKFIWKSFFNPRGFVLLIVLLLILGIGYLAFQEQIANYKEVMTNPCTYCSDCQKMVSESLNRFNNKSYNTISVSEFLSP